VNTCPPGAFHRSEPVRAAPWAGSLLFWSINKIADTLSIHRVTIYRRVLLWIKANCKRPFCRIGVPTEPEERFVCPNCDLDDFPEVTTECGCRVFDILPRLKSGDSYCAHPGIEPE
jgi:hypothetical protein